MKKSPERKQKNYVKNVERKNANYEIAYMD